MLQIGWISAVDQVQVQLDSGGGWSNGGRQNGVLSWWCDGAVEMQIGDWSVGSRFAWS